KVTLDDLKEYIESNSGKTYKISLNEFVAKQRKHKNKIVVADLSDQVFGARKSAKLLDLKGVNFVGSLLNKTAFIGCDLEGAKFCSVNLDQVEFRESNLTHVDFRLADLGTCKFANSYGMPPWNVNEGIKLSASASCIRVYADIKNEIAKKNEEHRLLRSKMIEVREVKEKTPLLTRLGIFLGLIEGSVEYRRAIRGLKKMHRGVLHTEHMIHTSFHNLFNPESCVFDPIILGSGDLVTESLQKKYIPLNRDHLMDYLKKRKKSAKLSLNEFVKELYIKSNPKGAKISSKICFVADLSSKVNVFGNNEWNRADLSGLDFTNADLSGVNFSGSNLSKCNFTGANISNSSFESALMHETKFERVVAVRSNFYHCDFSKSIFKKSDFTYARFDWSVASLLSVESVKMDHITASNAKWPRAVMNNVSMSYSDCSNMDLNHAKFTKANALHSLFNESNINRVNFIKSDVTGSLFNNVSASHTIWEDSVANNIEARRVNFTGSKFSPGSFFENSDFSYSIFDGVKAPMAHFSGSVMDHVKAGYAKFAGGNFAGSSMKFIDLNSCILNESNLIGVDLTASKLFNTCMVKCDLNKSSFFGADVKESNFTKAIFKDSDWQSLNMQGTILDNINNHRIKINDNTEITDCKIKALDGQFYHYDEDDFMDIMFIEQLESNIARVKNAAFLRKLGALSFIPRTFTNNYKISKKEVRRLHNIKLRNMKYLKKYLKNLVLQEASGSNSSKFKILLNNAARL
ncbi:pentapeptide repeat-containing protein, partial [Rickettsiaceae bacterium]|nr:pentapeptide repeat-containing protein [Rickettsiaceae bacterium]